MQSEDLHSVVHATPLPDELAACQAIIVGLRQKVNEQEYVVVEQARAIAEQSEKITTLEQQVQEQQLTINELLQRAFRHRSERYLEDPNQLKLDLGNTPEAADAAAGLAAAVEEAEIVIAAHKRRRHVPRKPRNEQLPAHLPRYEVEAPVPDDVKHCAEHGARKPIGYDRTETLEFERPKLKVRVTLYPKYICENEPQCGVAQPPRALHLNIGERDAGSPIDEVRAGLQTIARAYQAAGAPQQFTHFIEPGAGHVLSDAMWQRARAWFEKHLK